MNFRSRRLPALLGMLVITLEMAQARPVVIENVSTISNPNPALWTEFPMSVAVDGDSAIVTAQRWTYPTPELGRVHQTAFLYKRGGSGWTLVRQLEETVVDGGTQNALSVAMKNGIAAVHTTPMTIYQRDATDWSLAPSDIPPGDKPGFDLEIDGGRILNGQGMCSWDASVVEKSSDGVWRRMAVLPGSYRGCIDYHRGGSVDIAGDWAVVHQQNGQDIPWSHEQAWIYRRGANGWTKTGIADIPWEYRFYAYTQVAIRGSEVFVSAGHENGINVFRDVPGQGFRSADRIRPLDTYMGGGETFQLDQSADYLLQKANVHDRGMESLAINVFQRGADGRYAHAAVLAACGNRWKWFPYEQSSSNVAVSGRTVLATDHNEKVVYHFELPSQLATPAPRQDTFNIGNAPDWVHSAGSQFTVLRGDRSRVLRHAQATGEAKTIYQPANWQNQAIEVDVSAAQFADRNAAISLITRWQGPHNYYEFVWGPERFEFRRMASNTMRTLVSFPGASVNSPQPGRNYRVRLESIGKLHRIYIDGLLYQTITSSGPSQGRVGIGTYRARADFDNVLVTPTPVYSMYRNHFYWAEDVPWTRAGDGDWHFENDADVRLVQTSTAGDARVTIGVPATEQSVQTVARLIGFAAPTGTQRRWFGVVARYVDDNNHYLLALRDSNTLVLSKRVNGQLITLGSHAAQVTPGRDYTVRLDAIGSQLRAYLDGRLLFEATDDTHREGNSGMTTFKTHAEFESFVAYQP